MEQRISDITLADSEDLDEILHLVNMTNKEWFLNIIPAEYSYEPFLTKEQFMKMSDIMEFFVRRYDGNIIAVGSIGKRDEETAWIPLMYIRSDFQRKGLGANLVSLLENIAIQRKYSKMHLETDSEAYWAVNFYLKHGYSTFKKEKNPWGYSVWLEKPLKDK